jgi:hypothetical protein
MGCLPPAPRWRRHGLVFAAPLAPAASAPPTNATKDAPRPVSDALPCSCLVPDTHLIQASDARLGPHRMQPWESAALFNEACESKAQSTKSPAREPAGDTGRKLCFMKPRRQSNATSCGDGAASWRHSMRATAMTDDEEGWLCCSWRDVAVVDRDKR